MIPQFETLKTIVTSTITIGIVTGIVYLAGIFYDGGVLETLKIETSLFPKSFEDHILTGGLTLFSNYMRTVIYIALALVAPYLFLSIAWEVKDSRFITYLFEKPSAQLTPTPGHHVSLQYLKNKALHALFIGLALTVFVLIVASVLVSSYESGARYAKKLNTEQSANPEKLNSRISLAGGQVISALIIRCSEHRCAVLNKNLVSIIPMSEISKIEPPITQPEEKLTQRSPGAPKGL